MKVDKRTGEILEPKAKLNEVIVKETIRKDGSRRIQQDFSNCPTLAEQHTAHLTNINYLMEKYKPDELAAYIAARSQYRQEIVGHDFSRELSLQDAKNVVYQSKEEFKRLQESDPDTFSLFRNHVEFLKFIDNPANADKMLKLGLLTKKSLDKLVVPEPTAPVNSEETTTT